MKRWFVPVCVMVCAAGCGGSDPMPLESAPVVSGSEARHDHAAPHGGALVVLGEEEAHLEFLLEQATGRLTAYVLDGEAENFIRISQPTLELFVKPDNGSMASELTVSLAAVASPLTGETSGDASRFEAIVPELRARTRFAAVVVRVGIKGIEYRSIAFGFPEGNEHVDHH